MLNYYEGIFKIAIAFLSIVAGMIAINLFHYSQKKKELYPWKILIIALIFFVFQEILGALRAFEIYSSPFLTHIIPTAILGLIIYAIALQIIIIKKKSKV